MPVKPEFTHTLEPSRPVQGRVTDKATGKPLAGLVVELIPMRRHGGMPFYARTDADGRYRVSGHQAESYGTTVYPAPESGYLTVQDQHAGWPAGARFLEKNFALDRGKVVHGRVIDAGTKRPIAGAAVVYRPERDHPGNDRAYKFDNPVVSDAEGRFAITTLPGGGILAAETTDAHYMRTPIDDDGTYGNAFPQGVATIDVPKDREPPPAEILVRKGVTLEVKVHRPRGQAGAGDHGHLRGDRGPADGRLEHRTAGRHGRVPPARHRSLADVSALLHPPRTKARRLPRREARSRGEQAGRGPAPADGEVPREDRQFRRLAGASRTGLSRDHSRRPDRQDEPRGAADRSWSGSSISTSSASGR